MKKSDVEIIQALVAGGIIGASLGALITKNKEGSMLGAIAGAAVLATYQANQEVIEKNIPVYVEEKGNLYLVGKGGKKKFVKPLQKSKIKLEKRFKLS